MPAVPELTSVERLSGQTARIVWIPLTPDEARGILTLLEIVYHNKKSGEIGCSYFNPTDTRAIHIKENLFEQTTANVNNLVANNQYCVVIQVSTVGGESGFSKPLELPCKLTSNINVLAILAVLSGKRAFVKYYY